MLDADTEPASEEPVSEEVWHDVEMGVRDACDRILARLTPEGPNDDD